MSGTPFTSFTELFWPAIRRRRDPRVG
jgi:hypothetical protein